MNTLNQDQLARRIANTDWDFEGVKSESRFADFHWQPGKFASQLPAALIGLLSEKKETVLDPFCGSGTTLVEAQRLQRQSIGFDINPISQLIATAKLVRQPSQRLREIIEVLITDAESSTFPDIFNDLEIDSFVPRTVQKKWYTRHVLLSLTSLFESIAEYNGIRSVLARAAFSSILLSVCREYRHWGYVCDNTTPPLDSNRGADVFHCYRSALKQLSLAYEERDSYLKLTGGSLNHIPNCEAQCTDAIMGLQTVSNCSVELVVTSPPYFGVVDYVKAQRLSFEWFGLDIESLRRKEIGARSKRHRITAQSDYVKEISAVLREVKRVLKPHRFAAFVIGESKARAATIDTVVSEARIHGLTKFMQIDRKVSIQRRQMPTVQEEQVIVFQNC